MSDYRVARSLLQLRDQINAEFPKRNKGSDGTIGDVAHQAEGDKSDHNPWVKDSTGEGVVRALDITHDPAHGCDSYALADRLRASKDNRVSYIISNGRIAFGSGNPNAADRTPLYVWRKFNGAPHTDHMHVSVSRAQLAYDSARSWAGVTQEENDVNTDQDKKLSDIAFAVTQIPDPANPGQRIPLQTAISRLLGQTVTLSDAQVQAIADKLIASNANGLTPADHAGIVTDIRSVFSDAATE